MADYEKEIAEEILKLFKVLRYFMYKSKNINSTNPYYVLAESMMYDCDELPEQHPEERELFEKNIWE
jgi:hypothetical protein